MLISKKNRREVYKYLFKGGRAPPPGPPPLAAAGAERRLPPPSPAPNRITASTAA